MLAKNLKTLDSKVAPVRERGLKLSACSAWSSYLRRSREGAWIEICAAGYDRPRRQVAPVRERGLKSGSTESAALLQESLP